MVENLRMAHDAFTLCPSVVFFAMDDAMAVFGVVISLKERL